MKTQQASFHTKPSNTKSVTITQRATSPPTHPTLQLQQQIGNRAMGSLLQAKLTIGQPNDPYEKEADRIAAQVVDRIHTPALQPQTLDEDEKSLQSKPQLQAKGNTLDTPDGFEAQLAKHQSSGQALPTATRDFMEPRFGADFSHVRIHQTPALADSIHAKAFTHSNHIYFNQGQYSPGTQRGKLILAHELTHVLQQQSAYGRVNKIQRLPEQLFTSDSFSPEMVRGLSDNDLQEKSKILEKYLQNLTQSDPTFTVSRNNLVTLRYEIARRAISGSKNSTEHQTAAKQLVEFTRQQLTTFPELVQQFIQQSESDAQEKVRILGKVVAAVARMEFLLGTIYHQGKTWEETKDSGYMVDVYRIRKPNEPKSGLNDPDHWCAMFATNVLSRVTGRDSLRTTSGYKVANPGEFSKLNLDYQEEQGGKFVGTKRSQESSSDYRQRRNYNPWALLKKSLDVAGEQAATQDKEQILKTFFASYMRPQAGDIMVLRRGKSAQPNSFNKPKDEPIQSHTTVIEGLDGFKLHTIEGNKTWITRNESNRSVAHEGVRGRTFDLTDPDAVEEIVFIARPSLDSLTDNSYEPSSQDKPSQHISEETLLQPINHINQLLEIILTERECVQIPSSTKSNYVSDLGPA